MSDVRTCEACGAQDYASRAYPSRVTVEYVADDGMILSRDWTLCATCATAATRDTSTTCPFCLEPIGSFHDPADCPQK